MEPLKKIISWDSISIGNPDIDIEHRKLLEIYNDLVDLIVLKKSREEYARILSKMTDYSMTHFKREERYMENLHYPAIKEYRDFHKKYIYKVAMYNIDLSGGTVPIPEEIAAFLKDWWMNHILYSDFQIEVFKKENHLNIAY